MSTLEERIGELMRAMQWDVSTVASIAGVTTSAVSQWLGNGSKVIKSIGNLEAALLLERESGFSALWLAKGKGPKTVKPKGLGQSPASVNQFTPLPPPFDQSRFDALSPEEQQDVAQVAAYLTGAFARYNKPPGGRKWTRSRTSEEERQVAEGPYGQKGVRKERNSK